MTGGNHESPPSISEPRPWSCQSWPRGFEGKCTAWLHRGKDDEKWNKAGQRESHAGLIQTERIGDTLTSVIQHNQTEFVRWSEEIDYFKVVECFCITQKFFNTFIASQNFTYLIHTALVSSHHFPIYVQERSKINHWSSIHIGIMLPPDAHWFTIIPVIVTDLNPVQIFSHFCNLLRKNSRNKWLLLLYFGGDRGLLTRAISCKCKSK